MASAEQSKAKSSKSSKSQKQVKVLQSSNPSERIKTVVRRLPPNLPEDVFWQSVQPWVTEETILWKAFYQGKLRKRLNKENIASRAYIAFKTEEQLASFSQAYDGHLFRDKAGNESQAVVEFAPCQKIPPEKKKIDSRNATIEQDEDYISFVQSLTASTAKPPEAESLEALLMATQSAPEPKSTPLLDALRAEKSAARDKESILRNHAHYHTHSDSVSTSTTNAKKDDLKKKGASKQTDEQTTGRKSARGKKGEAARNSSTPLNTAASGSGSGKNVPPASQSKTGSPASQSKPAGPSSKSSRPPRDLPMRTHQPSDVKSTPSSPAVLPSTAHKSDGQSSPVAAPTGPRERRSRPVIGLASRHFEAALSGAGVAVNADGGERRQRREREEKASALSPASDRGGGSVITGKDTDNKARDRLKGGGRRKDGISESRSGESARSDQSKAAAPPIILHRPDGSSQPPKILTRPPEVGQAQGQSEGGGRSGPGRHRPLTVESGRGKDKEEVVSPRGDRGDSRGRRRPRGRPPPAV